MTTSEIELNTSPVNALVRPSVRDAFDEWAARRGMSRSAAVKHLINRALHEDGYDVDASPVMPPQAAQIAPAVPEGHHHHFRGSKEHDDARGDVLVWRCACGVEKVHGVTPTTVTAE